jgi:hypothetical protein
MFRDRLKKLYYTFKAQYRVSKFIYWSILRLGYKLNFFSIYNIPIIINNFNRLTFPLQLITFLEACGFTQIIVLDNNSTYPPLLDFYKNCKHTVIRNSINYGYLALWKSGLYRKYKWNYFVYSDSDVVPINECPQNFIELFKKNLDASYRLDKIGFGIKIDDLPDQFSLKRKVIDYEKIYWQKEIAPNLYEAKIDTTFALYKPLSNLKHGEASTLAANRFGFPYLVRHLPWYSDSNNLSEEENYYLKTSNSSSSLGMQIREEGVIY